MKTVLIYILLSLFSLPQIFGQETVELVWDRNPESEGITAYRVHYGKSSRSYTTSTRVENPATGKPGATFEGLESSKIYYFSVTSLIEIAGLVEPIESAYSSEIVVAFSPPELLHSGPLSATTEAPNGSYEISWSVIPGTYTIEKSTDLIEWESLSTHEVTSGNLDYEYAIQNGETKVFFRIAN